MSRVPLCLLLAAAALLAAGQVALAQTGPEFKLGFKALADQIPAVVGVPLESERWGASGDSLQQTSKGLMVWRKADNWTAFTNGSRTWVSGPFGVMERSNEQRFAWEAPPPAPTPVPTPGPVQILSPATTPTVPAGVTWDAAAEQAALEMINQSRRQYGAAPLAMEEGLRGVARAHALDMSRRQYFAHLSPEGKSPFDRMKAAGISYRYAAENLGMGYGQANSTATVRANHEAMMAEVPPEDGHRRNILNPNLTRVGIGVYQGPDGKSYYVSDFTG